MSPGVILAILAWCGCGLMFLLLWLEFRLRVLHPASLLFITLLLLTLLAPLVSAGLHLWRRIRRRAGRIGWTLVSFVPLALCAIWGAYAYDRGNRRVIPHNLPMKLINVAAASVEEAHLVYLYPHRIETPRLVMFYRDGLPDPQADAAAMDQHVARMEQLTDLRLRSKIFYVRGPLFDDRHVAFLGLAYGSGQGRAEYVDLHELAHAVIGQHAQIDSDPPTLLSEGWAESQSVSAESLAHRALSQRRYISDWCSKWGQVPADEKEKLHQTMVDADGFERMIQLAVDHGGNIPSWLDALTQPFWYHHDKGIVYPIGGAFSSYVIRRFGAGRFVQLYFATKPGAFDRECRQILGEDIQTIENDFWQEQERLAGQK